MPLENKKFFSGMLLEIHRNKRCEAVSSTAESGSGHTTRARAKPEVCTCNLKNFACGRACCVHTG